MTPWWLITLGGMLGSAHCVGMCGGFAMLLGVNRTSLWENLRTQLVYSAGRIASYGLLGAMAGFSGKTLMQRLPAVINVPAGLSILAGVFLIWEGLGAAGIRRRRVKASSGGACGLLSPLMSVLLRHPSLRHAAIVGVVTAFLPCGLVYAFVSLAGSSGDLLTGAGVMIAFGLGTVPLMVVTGTGAMYLPVSTRQRLWTIAAWSVILTGTLTFGRGMAFLQSGSEVSTDRCPLCTTSSISH